MTGSVIAGVAVPDSRLARHAIELVRDTVPELIYHHSMRVFLWGSLQSRALQLSADAEMLLVAALFHDLGLVTPYRTDQQRFELDGAAEARRFLEREDVPELQHDEVWTAIALHTTPEIPYGLGGVIAATTAGVETDVLGLHRANLTDAAVAEVVGAHPRPDFKRRILQAFKEGFEHRPDSTFGTVNADVLEHFVPGFRRGDFVEVIQNSHWPE